MITAEQINAMKPSWENPVKVIGKNSDKACRIISPVVNDEVAIYRDKNLGFFFMSLLDLQEYTFPEKPKKTLYHFIYKGKDQWYPGLGLVTKDGRTQSGKMLDYEYYKILESTAIEVEDE